jgi:predicted dehydrogenase
MQKYLREGRLGTLLSIWSRRLVYSDPAKVHGWRADHALSGGLLYEINVHELEWMMRLGGPVQSLYARTWARDKKTPRANDHLWFILNFANGAVGSHEGSQASPSHEFQKGIIGTGGGIITDRWGRGGLYAKAGEKEAPAEMEPNFDKNGHFLDCIEKGAEPVADVHWGVKVMAAAEAVIQSAASGQVVKL